MTKSRMLEPGRFIPETEVARIIDGRIRTFSTYDLLNNGRYVLLGMPGSYTPVCTIEHVPTLFDKVDKILSLGIRHIYCLSADNPWSLDTWTQQFPKHDKITFLSDGNGDFLRESGMSNDEREIFVGNAYGRFVAIIQDRVLIHLSKESSVLDIGATEGRRIVQYLENIDFDLFSRAS